MYICCLKRLSYRVYSVTWDLQPSKIQKVAILNWKIKFTQDSFREDQANKGARPLWIKAQEILCTRVKTSEPSTVTLTLDLSYRPYQVWNLMRSNHLRTLEILFRENKAQEILEGWSRGRLESKEVTDSCLSSYLTSIWCLILPQLKIRMI